MKLNEIDECLQMTERLKELEKTIKVIQMLGEALGDKVSVRLRLDIFNIKKFEGLGNKRPESIEQLFEMIGTLKLELMADMVKRCLTSLEQGLSEKSTTKLLDFLLELNRQEKEQVYEKLFRIMQKNSTGAV